MSAPSAVDRSRELTGLLARERNSLVEFILRLADFNKLKCWAELGHTSLWTYLRRELGLSEAMASYRAAAAELGPATVNNLSLRCAVHNLRAAERSYGQEFMSRF